MPPGQTASAGDTSGDGSTAKTLRCALTGEEISAEEAYWAPPLVTAKELATTIASTAFRAPGELPQLLFAEQPDVPYSPSARDKLAAHRTVEQLKIIGPILLIAGLIIIIIVFTMGGT
ncbi:MAG: hypothetical protein HC828_20450 [Blastochloris sp.]|nr:hypothetical protein [Blastochloris sp.]